MQMLWRSPQGIRIRFGRQDETTTVVVLSPSLSYRIHEVCLSVFASIYRIVNVAYIVRSDMLSNSSDDRIEETFRIQIVAHSDDSRFFIFELRPVAI